MIYILYNLCIPYICTLNNNYIDYGTNNNVIAAAKGAGPGGRGGENEGEWIFNF